MFMQHLSNNVDTTLISGRLFDVGVSTLIPRWNNVTLQTSIQRLQNDVEATLILRCQRRDVFTT